MLVEGDKRQYQAMVMQDSALDEDEAVSFDTISIFLAYMIRETSQGPHP